MRLLLCAVAAIALMVPPAAIAQPQNPPPRQARPEHGRPAHQRSQGQQGPQHRGHPSHERTRTHQARPSHQRAPTHHGVAGHEGAPSHTYHSSRPGHGAYPAYRPGHRPSTYHRIHAPAFRYPHGYHYRHWGIGAILPGLFLSNSYYWSDWAALGIGPPPPGYVWVRYGPDLLLVNRHTGRIVDVIYGAFY